LIHRIFTLSQIEFSSPLWRRKRIRSFNSAKPFRVVISSRLGAPSLIDRLIRVFIPPNANQHDAISFDEEARRRLSKLSVHSGDMNTLL